MSQELIEFCNMLDIAATPLGLQATVERVLPHGVIVCLSGPERRSKQLFVATDLLTDSIRNGTLSAEIVKDLKDALKGVKAS